jgi:hypothetical protein
MAEMGTLRLRRGHHRFSKVSQDGIVVVEIGLSAFE